MSSRPSALADLPQGTRAAAPGSGRRPSPPRSGPAPRRAGAGRAALVRHVPALLGQPGEHVVDVADQLDLGDEVLVDLGRQRVDADDLLVAARVPVLGRVLDQVVADRDHHVGLVEAGHRVVARLQPDRAERLRVVGGSSPLPMKVSATGMPVARTNSRSAGVGAAADHAVARQRHRVDRAADQVGRLEQLARRGLRADGRCAAAAAVDLGGHHVLGQLDVRGAGLLALGHLEGLAHDLGDDVRVLTRAFHLVIGRITRTRSMYWCDSLCIRSRSPWPVRATSGARSR